MLYVTNLWAWLMRIIPHLSGKTTAYEMWKALQDLFQNNNEDQKMVLREKLEATKIIDGENVTLYLMGIQQVHDELTTIGDNILETRLVRTALKGFSKEWKPFIKGIVSHEKLPDWNRLWEDFIQEEL